MALPFLAAGGWHLLRWAGAGALGWLAGKQAGAALVAGAEAIKNAVPSYEEEATVIVYGDSNADRRRMRNLALSIAFGLLPNRNEIGAVPPPGLIFCEIDMMKKTVTVYIKRRYNSITSKILGFRAGRNAMIDGPGDDIVGGDWPFWTRKLFNAQLQDTGRTLVTNKNQLPDGTQVKNPQMPGDKISRGTYLKSLVTAALTPASPVAEPPNPPGNNN